MSRTVVCFRGEQRTIADWCRLLGLKRRTYEWRRSVGWTAAQALSTPVRQQRQLGQRAHARCAA